MKLVIGAALALGMLIEPAISGSSGAASPVFQELRKAVIALDCSEYADSPDTFLERNRLREVGFASATDLMEKYRAGQLSKDDAGQVNFVLRIDGPFGAIPGHETNDFVLGRLFEASVIHAREAAKAIGTPDAWKELYKKNNCDLID